jgi:hypothetical protein
MRVCFWVPTFLFFAAPLHAQSPCTDLAAKVKDRLGHAWAVVRPEYNSAYKDAVYSAQDYANVFYQLHARIPYKIDRTKGAFLELEDRVRYARRVIEQYYAPREAVYAVRDAHYYVFNSLARCYGR